MSCQFFFFFFVSSSYELEKLLVLIPVNNIHIDDTRLVPSWRRPWKVLETSRTSTLQLITIIICVARRAFMTFYTRSVYTSRASVFRLSTRALYSHTRRVNAAIPAFRGRANESAFIVLFLFSIFFARKTVKSRAIVLHRVLPACPCRRPVRVRHSTQPQAP